VASRRIEIVRVYDRGRLARGEHRVLVDRLWPRGIRKDALDHDEWAQDVAPSTDLRRWYAHEPDRFAEFKRRYRRELAAPPAAVGVARLRAVADRRPLVLLTATRDLEHSGAAVLRAVLQGEKEDRRTGIAGTPARRFSALCGNRTGDTMTTERKCEEEPMPLAREHTYLRTHKLSGKLLRFALREEDARVREQAVASKAGRAAKTLVKEGALRVTYVALRKGAALQAHQVAGAVSIHVQRGRLRVLVDGGAVNLGPGDLAALGEGVSHSAEAASDCAILITAAMS
jgi:uncharacterized protein YeaO (DUF488 family)/quercetin dioxygenase-like cupin family protein